MKQQRLKQTNPRRSLISYIELAAMLLLTLLKCRSFYGYIGLAEYVLPVSLATASILLVVYTVLLFLTKKNPSTVVFGLYVFLSLAILIDRMYYSYFTALPGIAKIVLIKYMAGVPDSVESVMSFSHFLSVIDLPVFILYFIFLRKRAGRWLAYGKEKLFGFFRAAAVLASVLAIAFTVLFLNVRGGYYGALNSELFVYHATDLFTTVFPNQAQNTFDPIENVPDSEPESAYFGIGQGRNLINIQVEAMNEFVIGLTYNGQEVTPNLNRLLQKDTLYFDNYYWPILGGGGTSDAEFSVNNSLYCGSAGPAYDMYTELDYCGLPILLKEKGYAGSYVFHAYDPDYWNRRAAYPYQGFDRFYSKEDFEPGDKIGLGLSDVDFFHQSTKILAVQKQPFYAFLITLSSHHPFALPEEYCTLDLMEEHEGTYFGNYLQSIHYADMALGSFIDELKAAGLYENSVITFYGDHYALNKKNDGGFTSSVIGREYTQNEIYKIPLIIHVPGSGVCETVSKTGSHVDYEPTILDVLGIVNDRAVMFGQDLLDENTVGHVYGQNHMTRGGFISDEVIGLLTATGLKVYDKETMTQVDAAPYQSISDAALKAYRDCESVLDNNRILLAPQNSDAE